MNEYLAASGSVTALSSAEAERMIAQWLRGYVSELLSLPPEEIDESLAMQRYGLDSSAAVGLAGDLGDWLGYDLDATITYDHPSIGALAAVLSRDEELLVVLANRHMTSATTSALPA